MRSADGLHMTAMWGALELVVDSVDGHAHVEVLGELDAFTAPRLQEHLLGLIDQRARQVSIDLAGVGLIDSAGISVLTCARRRMDAYQGELVVTSVSPLARRVLELAGLKDLMATT